MPLQAQLTGRPIKEGTGDTGLESAELTQASAMNPIAGPPRFFAILASLSCFMRIIVFFHAVGQAFLC